VECARCSATFPVGASFCPQCGAARAGGGSRDDDVDEVKAGRRRLLLTGFACLLIGLMAGQGFDRFDFNGNRS
jgi:hypothetical protein